MCTRKLNEQIQACGKDVPVEDFSKFSMAHKGQCWRKSKYLSATAEEFESAKAAEQLLFNKDDKLRKESTCVFIETLVANNDTRSPKKFIKKQNEIIGSVADG